ncbi:MAG: carbon storage regulator [Planctomycetota bacterium]|nr:carbon storage regulator [Planctomycetota bacterium]
MLVLSRKRGEEIRIGDGITVTVLEIRGEKTKLGISAPREIPVVRTELIQQVPPARAESCQLL